MRHQVALSGLVVLTLFGMPAMNVAGGPSKVATRSSHATRTGHTWHLPSIPTGEYVDCPSQQDCVAVGSGSNLRADAFQWNGIAWRPEPVPYPPGVNSNLIQVSCAMSGDCLAIGATGFGGGVNQFLDVRVNGSWTMVSGPQQRVARSMSCVSTTNCWIVGNDIAAIASTGVDMAEHWNGRRLVSVRVPHDHVGRMPGAPNGASFLVPYELDSVSCPTTNRCIAVGSEHDGGFGGQSFELWNGSTWRLQNVLLPMVHDGHEGVWALSCTSTRFCMAVGGGTYLIGYRWNGRSWTRVSFGPQAIAGTTFGPALDKVSCVSPSNCLAVGVRASRSYPQPKLFEHWNGVRWHRIRSVAVRDTVTCDPTGYCLAT